MLSNLSSLLTKPGMLSKLPAVSLKHKLKEGENRYVSVMFADIVGFTHMSERLDHEVVQELFDQLMMSFSEIVIKYGGYVDKYEGDLVMVHFGSKEFLEQVSLRAVYAGLELIEVIEKFNEIRVSIPELVAVDKDLKMRIGINSGWVTTGKIGLKREGDFTVYGDVVNLAARMESNGVPNRIMLSEELRRELAPYVEFESNGIMHFKGISEAIGVYLVKSIVTHAGSRVISDSSFIGRDRVMSDLLAAYRNCKEHISEVDNIQLIGIKAPAGMGKTRIIKELTNMVDTSVYISEISPLIQNPYASFSALIRQFLLLPASCSQTELKSTFISSFCSLVKTMGVSSLAESLKAQQDVYGYLLGLNEDNIVGEPKEVSAVINNALMILIRAMGEQHGRQRYPLVLVFDDLHFADELSLTALDYISKYLISVEDVGSSSHLCIMFLLLYRDYYTPSQVLSDNLHYTEIELSELTEGEIKQFISHNLSGQEINEQVITQITQKSAGNPMFIEEWLNIVQDRYKKNQRSDWDISTIPNGITALILTRLNELDIPTKLMLQHSSALGFLFPENLIRLLEAELQDRGAHEIDISVLDATDLLAKLSEGMATPTFQFRHELHHQAIYSTMLKSNRRILHTIAATIIEAEYQHELEKWYFSLVDHCDRAGEIDRCKKYLGKSIEYAHSLFMNKKELSLCDMLMEKSSASEIDAIMLRKAVLYLDMGDYLRAEEVLKAISQTQLEIGLNKDKYILAKVRMLLTRYDRNIAKDYLISHLDEVTTPEAKITGQIIMLDIRRQDANDKKFLADATNLLQQLAPTQSQYPRLENIIGLYYANIGDYSQAISYFDRTIEHCLQHRILLRWAHQNKANILSKTGRMEEAMLEYKLALKLAQFMDDDAGICKLLCDMGTQYHSMGDEVNAAKMLDESIVIAIRSGNLKQQGLTMYNLARLYSEQGELQKAKTTLSKCLRIGYKLSYNPVLSHGRDLLGDILYEEGRADYAKKIYLCNLAYQQEINDIEGIAHTYGNLGNIAADEQDFESAEEYYRLQQSILHDIGDVEGEGKAWYNWGILDAERGLISSAQLKVTTALELFSKGGFSHYIETTKEYLDDLVRENQKNH